MFGIGALPRGKRKTNLGAALDGVLKLFEARILPFDTSAARRYADLAVGARAAGKGFPTPDGTIAAIAAAHDFAVASRDTSAFKTAGLTAIDPSRELIVNDVEAKTASFRMRRTLTNLAFPHA